MDLANRDALLILNAVELLGPVRVRLLVEAFGAPAAALRQPKEALKRVAGIGEKIAQNIVDGRASFDLDKEKKLIREHGVSVVTPSDDGYPELLKEIYDPPVVLYVRGKLSAADRYSVGIVGSRFASHYGTEAARVLSRDLTRRGMTVVSGMARGIDTAAHEGAIAADGRTVAVLGNGLARCYPPENKGLMERIAKRGAVVSEFPMETIPDRKNFPRRNRIISGMSLGIVVVEAARRSGALITAHHALEQNRAVFSIPGRINDASSSGANDLIKQGAKIVTGAGDVIEEFQYVLPKEMAAPVRTGPAEQSSVPAAALTDEERLMHGCLSVDVKPIDELIRESGFPPARANHLLLSLELKGCVRQLPGKQFVRC
ncbi:MAG TPA: DNA-processing protein DprA [bacterium]|nr:DNA-processing protein DprA [bacterium]